MIKRFMYVLAAFALAVGVLFTPAVAGKTLAANPPVNCTYTGSTDPSSGYIWHRPNKTNITGATLDVIARALEPCLNGDATHASKSFLMVSIEATDESGNKEFPQLGFCKFRISGVDQTYFCWANPGDNGTPNIVQGPSLYPYAYPNNRPVGGHNYRFQITRINIGGAWKFRYNITDVTLADVIAEWDVPFDGGGGLYGTLNGEVWWGCETGTDANALGTLSGTSKAYMERAGYRLGSTWSYTQNSTVIAGPGPWTIYGDQKYSQDQGGMYNTDRVACYTN